MITITYKQMNSTHLKDTLLYLYKDRTLSQPTAWSFMKICRTMLPAYDKAEKMYKSMAADYALKDDKGEFVFDKVTGLTINPEKKAEYDAKIEEFLATQVTVDWRQFTADDLTQMKLAPADLDALEPFIADFNTIGADA